MHELEKKLDISSLPPDAQAELIDFFEFLSKKYSISFDASSEKENKRIRFKSLLECPIIVDHINIVEGFVGSNLEL